MIINREAVIQPPYFYVITFLLYHIRHNKKASSKGCFYKLNIKSLCLLSVVIIIKPDDIIFTEITAILNFYNRQR